MDFIFDLQLFGGGKGGGSTTVTSRQPTEAENALTEQALEYSKAVSPNALKLNDLAGNILYNSIGTTQQRFDNMNKTAQNQIKQAQGGYSNLANGVLPTAYLKNMSAAIKSGVQDAYGNLLNQSAQRGVLNSSVTNKGLNDISKNVSDTMARGYLNNVQTLGNLYGNQINAATAPITTAAAAQEAAQQPAMNLWNASLGLNGATTGALAAVSGNGQTTSTTSNGGGGLFSGLLGGLF